MANSMTGFGRSTKQTEQGELTVEIRSVNHRFLELTTRTPRGMAFLDERLKKQVSARLSRGKVDITVNFDQKAGDNTKVVFHPALAAQYLTALNEAEQTLNLKNDLGMSDLLRIPELFTIEKQALDEEAFCQEVSAATGEALDILLAMRTAEGEKMAQDLLARLAVLEETSYTVETLSAESVCDYQNRLRTKLEELLNDSQIDEQRIVTEAAIFADKIATDEETVRLRSHITQFRGILKETVPVGRKLDFLVQELNREINTIGSKCSDLNVTNLVVNQKSEIEKIREQVQNLE